MDPALQRLQAALEEYLAQGGDTPVAAEAQALMDAIGATAPEGDMGAPPMDQMGAVPPQVGDNVGDEMGLQGPPGAEPPPMGGPPIGDMPPAQPNAKTFEGARAGAKDRLKKLNKKQGTKA